MRVPRSTVRALVLVAGLLSAAPQTRAQDVGAVTRLLQDSLPRLGGGELILVGPAGVTYRRSVGTWDSTRALPIASATKWLSGALLMTLVDDGSLRLDDPVARWLPAFTGAAGTMTVRQLFSHTSGLPGESPCVRNAATTLAACVDAIAGIPLFAPPGTRFAYGGTSMHVAGRIAEVAGGAPWDSLFARRIARPLGMRQTAYENRARPTDNPHIGGGAWSTASDWSRFLQMLLARGTYGTRRILSPAAVEALVADQTGGAAIVYTPYTQYAYLDPTLPATRYGIGNWRERVAADGTLARSSSQGAFGWSPWVDWATGTAGVLAVFDELPRVMPTYVHLHRLLGGAVTAVPLTDGPAPVDPVLSVTPNPSRGAPVFHVVLAAPGPVRLTVVDALGRTVGVVFDGALGAGTHRFPGATALRPGLYVARLHTPGGAQSQAFVAR